MALFYYLVAGLISVSTIYGNPINRQAGISENVYITVQNDTYGVEQRVCSIESMTYEDGESIPTSSPCEHCLCRPPGFACTIISCEYRPGCKALKRSDQCCPEYQCECEKDGKIFQNGEKILDDNNPCEVCYCQGGDVICAVIDCYWRSDCQPRYINNRCCPLYDHCPPPSGGLGPTRPTQRPTTTSTTTLSTPISWFNMSSAIYATPSTTKKPTTTTTTTKTVIADLDSNNLSETDKITQAPSIQEANLVNQSEEISNMAVEPGVNAESPPLETAESVSEETVHVTTPKAPLPVHSEEQVNNIVMSPQLPPVQSIMLGDAESPLAEENKTETPPAKIPLAENKTDATPPEIPLAPISVSPDSAQSPSPGIFSQEQAEVTTSTEIPIPVAISTSASEGAPALSNEEIIFEENMTQVGISSSVNEEKGAQTVTVAPEIDKISSEEKLTTQNPENAEVTPAAILIEEITPVVADVGVTDSVPVVDERPPVVQDLPPLEVPEEVNTPAPVHISDTIVVAAPESVVSAEDASPTEKLPFEITPSESPIPSQTTSASPTSQLLKVPSTASSVAAQTTHLQEISPSTTIISSVPSIVIISVEKETENTTPTFHLEPEVSSELSDNAAQVSENESSDLVSLPGDNLQVDDAVQTPSVTDAPNLDDIVDKLMTLEDKTDSPVANEEITTQTPQVAPSELVEAGPMPKPSQNMEPPVYEFGDQQNPPSVPVFSDDMSVSLVPPKQTSESISSQVKPTKVEEEPTVPSSASNVEVIPSVTPVADDDSARVTEKESPAVEFEVSSDAAASTVGESNMNSDNTTPRYVSDASEVETTTPKAATETEVFSDAVSNIENESVQSLVAQDDSPKEEMATTDRPERVTFLPSSTTPAVLVGSPVQSDIAPDEIVFDDKGGEAGVQVQTEEATTQTPVTNDDAGVSFDAVPEKLDAVVPPSNNIIAAETSSEPDQTPIPNDHEFHPVPTTTTPSPVSAENEEEDEDANRDHVTEVPANDVPAETTEAASAPSEEKFRLDSSIFSDEEAKAETDRPEPEAAATEPGIVFETINTETHLPHSLSQKVETEIVNLPVVIGQDESQSDEPASTLTPLSLNSERHHLPGHEEEIEDATATVPTTTEVLEVNSAQPAAKTGIPVELVKKVDPISDDLVNDNSRSDFRSDADNEVSNADSRWYWRTFDRIRSLFPPSPSRSSRTPRSVPSKALPRFIFW